MIAKVTIEKNPDGLYYLRLYNFNGIEIYSKMLNRNNSKQKVDDDFQVIAELEVNENHTHITTYEMKEKGI